MTLQQVTLTTVNYRASNCSPVHCDENVQFCAGKGYSHLLFRIHLFIFFLDACQGGSDGPLMMFSPNKQWVYSYR
jgi:secreted trypsin-like serine protease